MEPDVFHITHPADWSAARSAGEYRAPSLASEGFIHCSTRAQVLATANRYYANRTDVLLLRVAHDRVATALRYEESRPGEFYPHVYAPIAIDAVRVTAPLVPDADGVFRTFPRELDAPA